MNLRDKRNAEAVARTSDDESAAKVIRELLDEIENLEYKLDKANDEISDLQSDVDKWQDEARNWEDKYYEAQNP